MSEIVDPVSVVIPAYNLAGYLGDAVRSVQGQTYRGPITIVILDDGSTDATLDVAQRLSRESPNLQVHTQSNQGRAATRNRLLALAPHEWVAWLDADDLAAPGWLDAQCGHLARNRDCVAVSGQGYSMTASGGPIGPISHPLGGEEIDARHLSGHANAFFQSCVVVRKSAVLSAGGYNEAYPAAEDYDLWLRLAEIGTLANVSATHLLYRVHATSANWTLNVDQRMQGHRITNEARARRGLAPLSAPPHEIPPAEKDDWNRRIYWINIALKSGNPRSALELLAVALSRHPLSLVFWLAAVAALCDTILFRGNRTKAFRPGQTPHFGTLPKVSCYRLGRHLNRLRRKLFA